MIWIQAGFAMTVLSASIKAIPAASKRRPNTILFIASSRRMGQARKGAGGALAPPKCSGKRSPVRGRR